MGRRPLLAAFGAATLASAAVWPSAANEVRAVEARARAAEAEARARQQEARAAQAEAETLAQRAAEAADRKGLAQADLEAAQRRLAGALLGATQAHARRIEGRVRLERTLMGLSLADAAPAGRRAADAGALAMLAAAQANARRAAERTAQEADQTLRLAAFERDKLMADLAALDRHQETVLALSTERAAEGERLMAAAQASRAEARRLAAQARSLTELARAASRRPPAARSAQAGPRTVPVAGARLARRFGAAEGERAKGVVLTAPPGAAVVAPASGTVSFAGPFMDYGEVLILERRDGYALLLAGLGETRVAIGRNVSAGEVVGAMPRAAGAASELYFEVRRQGTPVDPERWLPVELQPQTGVRLASRTASDEAGVRR